MDDDQAPGASEVFEHRLHRAPSGGVEVGGGFIEHGDGPVCEEHSSDADPAELTGGERGPTVTDLRGEAHGEGSDEVGQPHGCGGIGQVLIGCLGAEEAEVLGQGGGEEEGLLGGCGDGSG